MARLFRPGNTTVYITGDNGVQTIGSVGSGLCTHEGNGSGPIIPPPPKPITPRSIFTFVNAAAVTATCRSIRPRRWDGPRSPRRPRPPRRNSRPFGIYTSISKIACAVTTGVQRHGIAGETPISTSPTDFYLGFDYKLPWAERRGILRTHAPYETGTATITIGSSTLTGAVRSGNTANAIAKIICA